MAQNIRTDMWDGGSRPGGSYERLPTKLVRKSDPVLNNKFKTNTLVPILLDLSS